VAASGTLTFDPGVTSRTISVTVNGDAVVEQDELAVIGFSNPTGGATIGGFLGVGFGLIVNDDSALAVVPGAGTIVEGDAGSTVLAVPIRLSRPSVFTVTANWSTVNTVGSDRAQSPSDYVAASGIVTFSPGTTLQYVNLTVNGDIAVEQGEIAIVSVTGATGATIGGYLGLGFGYIVDNDGPTQVTPGVATIWETNSGTTTISIPVYLTRTSASVVTAQWNTADVPGIDKAQSPSDYVAASGTVTFAPGETVQYVTITVQADLISELDEVIVLAVHDVVNAQLGGYLGLGYGLVVNDDP